MAGYAINNNTGCWEWDGYLRRGYPTITKRVGDIVKHLYAHRVFYEMFNGVLYDAQKVDHLCRNKKCVNPEHLEAISNQVNVQRGDSAKLTKNDVLKIRNLYGEYKQTELAKMFGVGQDQISRIVNHKRWDNIK